MTMDNGIGVLTLDTLATRADFPTETEYNHFRRTINILDRLYRGERQGQRTAHAKRSKVATIEWYENLSEEEILEVRMIGPKALALMENLIERKYQERYRG
jgi:hypothetical protein